MFSNLITVLLTNKISEEVFVWKYFCVNFFFYEKQCYSDSEVKSKLFGKRANEQSWWIVLGIVFARPQM